MEMNYWFLISPQHSGTQESGVEARLQIPYKWCKILQAQYVHIPKVSTLVCNYYYETIKAEWNGSLAIIGQAFLRDVINSSMVYMRISLKFSMNAVESLTKDLLFLKRKMDIKVSEFHSRVNVL